MITRRWLMELPSTDPAFAPLHRAAEFDPDSFPAIERAHRQAVLDAAWGMSLVTLMGRVRQLEAAAERKYARRPAQLEAIGYALGVNAVRVALREHYEAAEEVTAS